MSVQWPLVLDIARNVGFIGIIAYITTRLPAIRRALTYSQYRAQDKLVLALVFGSFSALGNYIGIPVLGALANTRIVGPIAGGLIGGPIVGVGAGILGAIPRYMIGGYTVSASVTANILAGIISGLVYRKYGPNRLSLRIVLVTAVGCEIMLKILILLLAKPFERAWELEKIIGIPTIVANSLAVGLFYYIVRDVFKAQQKVEAQSAQQAIRLIQQTTELLPEGLNQKTAHEIASIIRAEIQAAAVAITDSEKVLAFIGAGSDHHKVNTPIVTRPTRMAMDSLQTIIVNTRQEIACPYPGCPLTSIIDAPLMVDGQLRGSLKLCKINNEPITAYEAELIQGIADFIGLLLDRRQLDEQKITLAQAEYNMLKAQVNPHFLFNTLGTIRALIRTSPENARARIKDLSDFLRRTLEHGSDLVEVAEEIKTAQSYISLEQSRFGDRIRILTEFDETLMPCLVPVFTLQPLVENAIKHGLLPKEEGGVVTMRIFQQSSNLYIEVEDDGAGIDAQRLEALNRFDRTQLRDPAGTGIGLYNVHKRLQSTFGHQHGLVIKSILGRQTIVQAVMPVIYAEEGLKCLS